MPIYDLVAIGRPFTDLIAHVSPDFVARHRLVMGRSAEMTPYQLTALRSELDSYILVPGGAPANTAAGIAALGGRAAFLGKVCDDAAGRAFRNAFAQSGVHFPTKNFKGTPSDISPICYVLIAPDGDITMPYSCGVADQLTLEDINAGLISSAKMMLIIGHLLFSKSSKAAAQEALKIARQAGVQVALSIHKLFLNKASKRIFLANYLDQADVLIGNRDEVEDLFGSFHLEDFREQPNLLVMTDAANGVLIAGWGNYLHLPALQSLPRGKDSFGAGDQFAAGFLYGIVKGLPLEKCGQLGNETAAMVIPTLSARPTGGWEEISRRYLG